ncbi:MAG TPA: FKBP-type peptidyl-prolyl cis-trans isomerase [Pseudonocardiaceae bacterium]|jgi:peptidylprolyl isomerase|nr:FKBP-type peptidyl-prolyl cis-trans isomerase [Pseudonocardiaceae bacterium]
MAQARTTMFAVASAALLAGAVLTGCGGSPAQAGCSGSDLPTVAGAPGTDPVISVPNGSPGGALRVCTLAAGAGPVVGHNDFVVFHVEGKVWAGDREVVDSYTNQQPQGLALSTAMPAWRQLAGQRIGSRVLMVVPPKDGFGTQGDPQANIMGSDTLVFVFDLLGTVGDRTTASGTTQPYHPTAGQPTVRDGSAGPTITVPGKATPPAALTTTVLRRGNGRPITNGQTVIVQYTGVVWRTGKVFDSSWARGFPEAFQLGAGQVLAGWEQGLGGRTVGSRLLLTVPPALGYGTQGDAPDVQADDTLVFVIDIVDAVTAPR